MELFKAWFEEAKQVAANTYPEAMTLATVRKYIKKHVTYLCETDLITL